MKHPVREEMVEAIKAKKTSWKPKEVHENHLRLRSVESIKNSMGHLGTSPAPLGAEMMQGIAHSALDIFKSMTSAMGMKDEVFKLKQSSDDEFVTDDDLPRNFSWREKMPECLGHIEDQGDCGSCWAFTSAGLLSDRFCIHTNGAITTRLSPQEMVDCNMEQFGCMGGYLLNAIDYLMVEGAVTQQCIPYRENQSICTYRCADGGKTPYDKYYCKPRSIAIAVSHEEIKRELITNGPMLMGLQIYEDFMNYESGIYKYEEGYGIGGHAMKLVGWGYDEEEGLYWEMQNQWTKYWGEDGFVRIKHGEIGIDSIAIACMPDLI